MAHPWIAKRMSGIDSSGIRKVFDLAAKMTDPVNLSIGQPDFDVPAPLKDKACEAIQNGKNSYSLTQGLAPLRTKLQGEVDKQFGHSDRQLMITSGTSGALVMVLMALVEPGDEVIVLDPFFVMYPALVHLAGGKCVYVDTYPSFDIPVEKIRAAITPRTKVILFNSPANPTGVVPAAAQVKALAELAAEKNIALVSDEIYSRFCYEPFESAAKYNPHTLVIDGFSKTYGMTGWRLGYISGPSAIIQEMIKLQQYTFVCGPTPFQWAAIDAIDFDMTPYIASYQVKRDRLLAGLSGLYEVSQPGGAFYVFPKVPWGTGASFVEEAIRQNLLIIPGNVFSHRDTHFRISYAASDRTIDRGIEILQRLAKQGG